MGNVRNRTLLVQMDIEAVLFKVSRDHLAGGNDAVLLGEVLLAKQLGL